jgi:type I restriction enzyme S subunit
MVVEKGYKETEIGVFPQDWDLITVDKIFTFYSTSNYSKAQMTLAGEVGCIHYGLIHAIPNSTYDVQDGIKYFISQEQAKYEFIKNGDIVMVDASEDMEGVNKSVELFGIENGKYIAGLHTFLLRDTNSILANKFSRCDIKFSYN